MKLIIIVTYNVFIYPCIFVLFFVCSFFNKKIRTAFYGKLQSNKLIKKFTSKLQKESNVYWIHMASLGEFYQSKIIIDLLKLNDPKNKIIASFSSPSGYQNFNSNSVDLAIYLPFDFPWVINKMMLIIKPKKIIICSYDLWPNLVWLAKRNKIHVNVFSFYIKSNRKYFSNLGIKLLKPLFNDLSSIYTVTLNDKKRVTSMLKNKTTIVRACGNPRYDTIKEMNLKNNKYSSKNLNLREKKIIIASTHKEDDFIIPILIKISKIYNNLKFLYVPHEPTNFEINRLIKLFKGYDENLVVNSENIPIKLSNNKFTLIRKIGILYNLYWDCQFAYVGGGFSSGIHNIMEPSIAGIPIIFGPKYEHANEAYLLLKSKGAFCISSSLEFETTIVKLLNDDKLLQNSGDNSAKLVEDNLGSSKKIVSSLLRD